MTSLQRGSHLRDSMACVHASASCSKQCARTARSSRKLECGSAAGARRDHACTHCWRGNFMHVTWRLPSSVTSTLAERAKTKLLPRGPLCRSDNVNSCEVRLWVADRRTSSKKPSPWISENCLGPPWFSWLSVVVVCGAGVAVSSVSGSAC